MRMPRPSRAPIPHRRRPTIGASAMVSPPVKQETLRAAGCQSAQPTAYPARETLSRAPLRRIVPLVFIERPVEFEPIGQHDHRLGAALTLIHCESDRLFPVREQAAAKALGVLDDP